MTAFATIPQVIDELRKGRMVVLVDDEDRENEGDLVMAAEFADKESIAFMATRGCGLICLSMEGQMVDRLGLALMSRDHRTSRLGTAFTMSIEARDGVSTGISAADRALTIRTAIAEGAKPEDLVSPGHVFPLRARDGGVLVRAGHSEASVDLCRLGGLRPAAVICEIMKQDGEMARLPDLRTYCAEHSLLLATIADLIAYREQRECLVHLEAESTLQTAAGPVRAYAYRSLVGGDAHLALVAHPGVRPEAVVEEPVLVRVQKENPLGDVFGGSLHPPMAMVERIAREGGVFLYMREGRTLPQRLVTQGGQMPVMDPREYGIGAQILHHLGVRRMRLMTGSDRPISALSGHGLEVVERVRP